MKVRVSDGAVTRAEGWAQTSTRRLGTVKVSSPFSTWSGALSGTVELRQLTGANLEYRTPLTQPLTLGARSLQVW